MFSSTSFSTLRRAKDDKLSWFKEFLRYDFTLFRVENDRSPDALLIGIDKYIRSKISTLENVETVLVSIKNSNIFSGFWTMLLDLHNT